MVININIEFYENLGLVLKSTNKYEITQYDNRVQTLAFNRPDSYTEHNLVLVFNNGVESFEPQNIEFANEFEIVNSLTQTSTLTLQIYFEKDGKIEQYSDVIKLGGLRSSIHKGVSEVTAIDTILNRLKELENYKSELSNNITDQLNQIVETLDNSNSENYSKLLNDLTSEIEEQLNELNTSVEGIVTECIQKLENIVENQDLDLSTVKDKVNEVYTDIDAAISKINALSQTTGQIFSHVLNIPELSNKTSTIVAKVQAIIESNADILLKLDNIEFPEITIPDVSSELEAINTNILDCKEHIDDISAKMVTKTDFNEFVTGLNTIITDILGV